MSTNESKVNKPRNAPLKVLLPLFPDFNTLDMNGPVEVLIGANRQSGGTQHFKISVASATELTTSIEGVKIARDISLSEATERLKEWDILLLPGGVEKSILGMAETWKSGEEGNAKELLDLLDRFMEDLEKLTLTVCTASLFLGALGRLSGRRATSHWRSLSTLKELLKSDGKYSAPIDLLSVLKATVNSETEIVRARWVDSKGSSESGQPRLSTYMDTCSPLTNW